MSLELLKLSLFRSNGPLKFSQLWSFEIFWQAVIYKGKHSENYLNLWQAVNNNYVVEARSCC